MMRKILFVDRDGCLIQEPADGRIDTCEKFDLLPDVIRALQRFVAAGYRLVMVTNQDGLGTPDFPEAAFAGPHALLLRILATQGIAFDDVFIDRTPRGETSATRKPGVGMMGRYLADATWDRAASAMVGDRMTDLEFAANMGVRGWRVGPDGLAWPEIAHRMLDAAHA